MLVKVYCMNCGEYIFDTDPSVLKKPFVGWMFKQRKDTEWHIFSPDSKDNDLWCPICSWNFIQDDTIKISPVDGFFLTISNLDELKNYLGVEIDETDEPEIEKPKFKVTSPGEPTFAPCIECGKPVPNKTGKYDVPLCSTECTKKAFKKAGKKEKPQKEPTKRKPGRPRKNDSELKRPRAKVPDSIKQRVQGVK